MLKKHFKIQFVASVILILILSAGGYAADKKPSPLGSYGIDMSAISVSGISSGAYMAQQFHVAHSKIIMGAGIIAGGPYNCANGKVSESVTVCTHSCKLSWWPCIPPLINVNERADKSISDTTTAFKKGQIDNPVNLRKSRTCLFLGSGDRLVPKEAMQALKKYYDHYVQKNNNQYVQIPNAEHAMITIDKSKSKACDHFGLPYLNYCNNRDVAGEMLQYIYSNATRRVAAKPGNLMEFDQTEFFNKDDSKTSMNEVAHVYVPDYCKTNKGCRLHVAFHGCEQYEKVVKDAFYAHAGYNEWAEANKIIILYPQTTAWGFSWSPFGFFQNPKGCWDWWGYSGDDYYVKSGKQMQAVKKMIDQLAKK